jgi:hypothetical protein
MITANPTRTQIATGAQTDAQATTEATPTWTNADLTNQGTTQGIKVAQTEANNPSFNISDYAASITPYLQSMRLNGQQVSTYLSAMESEFNYLTPTSQLDPSNKGVGSDILNEVLPSATDPNAAENPATTSPQTLVNQGTVLGQQLAAVQNDNESNFDVASYAQNIAQEMTKAGYNTTQTDAFSSAILMGYASALGGYINA